jgi:prohibitin 2
MASRTLARIETWIRAHFIGFSTTVIIVFFLIAFFGDDIFITIPPGRGGVLWLRFFGGTVTTASYGEGTKAIFPWDKIYIYDLRVRQENQDFDVLTREGLTITVNATLRFRLNPDAIGAINRYAGPEFVKTLVMPTVGASLRLVAAKQTLEEFYSTKRHGIEGAVLASLRGSVDNLIPGEWNGQPEILIEDFWIRSVRLPPELKSSIEEKLVQRQLADQYLYILQREDRERQRKIIEAQGIKAFQDIVSSGISENYLRWKGIDATLKLAESPNSKVVVIGAGKDGMPLILGSPDANTAATLVPPPQGRRGAATGALFNSQAATPPPQTALDPRLSMPTTPPGGPIASGTRRGN